ncbi:toprim domain-containing protein [Flagellimonas marinaquae]|nr:toprim domain-containing protein [Allomuricauda aquimarina]
MKEKRMNCETARNLCIMSALADMGHFPTRESKKEAWFLSPLRKETQASFKVSKVLNRWYDHGEGIGGNLIDLMMRITGSSVPEVLELLDGGTYSISPAPALTKAPASTKKGIIVGEVMDISHLALLQYLEVRCIPMAIARSHTKEVHFEMGNQNYFAIGLKNTKGGWELRNRFQKLCSSPKAISHFNEGKENLAIVEGMFDFLSLITIAPSWLKDSNILVLNSLAFANQLGEIIDGCNQCKLLLDNDAAGDKTTQTLLQQHDNVWDERKLFHGFKDLNEKLQSDPMMKIKKEVSLNNIIP